MRPLGLTQTAVGLTGRSVRASWSVAARAYELFSPVALRPRVPGVVGLLTVATDGDPERARDGAEPAEGVSAHRLADPILFLDGETGARVATAFLVENEGEEAVSAPIKVSAFSGPDGVTAAPVVTVSPAVLDLGPGEQALVQVAAVLGPELKADVRYVARISIPGLSQATVPIAARRRVAEAA